MNDFLERRHEGSPALADTIARFRAPEFADETARAEVDEVLGELDRLRDLESFLKQRGGRFRGQESADYETAQSLREQIEALEQMMESLARGDLGSISPEQLAEWLGIDINSVGLKAKTGEGIGPVGESRVIDSMAVVQLVSREAR